MTKTHIAKSINFYRTMKLKSKKQWSLIKYGYFVDCKLYNYYLTRIKLPG